METIKDWLNTPEISELRKKPIYEIIEVGFHRETVVPIFINKEILFSPANGIILYAKRVRSQDDLVMVHGTPVTIKDLIRKDAMDKIYDEDFIVIGIFMTFYDVHTNYMPSSGFIMYQKLQELKIDNISMTKVEMEIINNVEHINPNNMEYLFYNERMLNTVFDNNINQEYYIVQIADAEVGAIIPFHEQNYYVEQGWPFSAVRFGSQVDLIVPMKRGREYEIMVEDKIGWHVDAVRDPLIRITKTESRDGVKSESLIMEAKMNDAESWKEWDAAHPPKGRSGGGGTSGSGAGGLSNEGAAKVVDHTLEKGGGTFKLNKDGSVTEIRDGYIVATPESNEIIKDAKKNFTPEKLQEWVEKSSLALKEAGTHIGTWIDKGNASLDVSKVFQDRATAVRAGFENNQKSVVHLVNGEAVEFIDTKGSGFVNPTEGAIHGYGEILTQSEKKRKKD